MIAVISTSTNFVVKGKGKPDAVLICLMFIIEVIGIGAASESPKKDLKV